ncbi:MAG TPA: exotoxin [Morganella sp. (in: Bacteria)]|nr:exotoxin [Morganella sp. (in: enterobacteria)]
MKTDNRRRWLISACCLLLSLTGTKGLAAGDNLRFHGILVDEPCTIHPGDETVELPFGNIPDKNLYAYQRTPSKAFRIRLSECDTSIGKRVTVLFAGDENPFISGALAISPGSQAAGIAVGLENADGSPLAVNQESPQIVLNDGLTLLNFQAFVQGEPDALANKTIKRGPFSAIATFHLNYD